MAYQITSFDGLDLPVYNPTQDHSGGRVDSTLTPSIGGMFDFYSTTQRRGKQAQYSITGLYIGEDPAFLVDHSGNYIVDELGNFIATGSESASLAAQVNNLRAKIGVRGQLIRYQMGTNAEQWVTARLLEVGQQQRVDDREIKAELTCNFETTMDAWRAIAETVTSSALTVSANAVNIQNDGNSTVDDVVVEIGSAGTITSVRIQCAATGIDLTWTGSLLIFTPLEIDAGLMTIRNNSVDAFSGLTRNVGHTARGWLPLAVGVNTWTVTIVGATGTFESTHYDQYR
jgi:hypothetical protein